MASSKKISGAKAIAYNATKGTLVNSGALTANTWYKIYSVGTSTALPSEIEGFVFKSPYAAGDAITLASGDSVYPLTLEEVCKVDMEVSGESGVIDTTDSCDYPYSTSIPDGYTSLSGSINTMMRFDEATEELTDASQDFVNRFFTIMEDDSEGVYTYTAKDDSDLLFMILLNSTASATGGMIENWLLIPVILNSITMNIALKDVQKGDYAWTKGQGPATYYKLHVNASV